ncbi:carbonic anhydrase 4-like [Bombina bombina]|uniref:carbonic anhydrase 4-like n=1 Tax=Bombina bombina TaxID=8345 RepID=UPI00235A5AE8|nr:carbonic anhydrase 4-like [Bombina bombina]
MRGVFLMLVMFTCSSYAVTDWCYAEESCGPGSWFVLGFCNGSQQSPIDIIESSVNTNTSLGELKFNNYNDKNKLLAVTNNGHSVEVSLADGVNISGGGLPGTYSAVAFHFHWGNLTSPGSEHRLNGKQYPMEMHIVHTKENMNLTEAKNDPTGMAVLGFFIDVVDFINASDFELFSSLLPQISSPGDTLSLNSSFSLDALLGGVDRTVYYRYKGSLTTPNCNEVVLWTVFRDPIKVQTSVVKAFSSNLYHNVSGELETLINNFRPTQALNSREIQVSSMQKFNVTSMASVTHTSSLYTTKSASHHDSASLILTVVTTVLLLRSY